MCQPFHNMWHHQGLTRIIKKKLKYASANALKMCAPGITQFSTHTLKFTDLLRELSQKKCAFITMALDSYVMPSFTLPSFKLSIISSSLAILGSISLTVLRPAPIFLALRPTSMH